MQKRSHLAARQGEALRRWEHGLELRPVWLQTHCLEEAQGLLLSKLGPGLKQMLFPTACRKRGLWRAHHCQPRYRRNPLLEQELGQSSCICDIPTTKSWPNHPWLHQLLAGQVGAEWQAGGIAWKQPGAEGMRTRAAHPPAGQESAVRRRHWEFSCSLEHRQQALPHRIF